jgi:uncharacterized Tic20 family protein
MSDPTNPERPQGDAPGEPLDPPPGSQPYGQPPAYGQQPPPQHEQPPAYGQQPPQYAGPQYAGPPQHPAGPTSEEITWGAAAHWSALVASIIALAFLGPLIVMLTKGNESPYVRRQAVESLNFQLSMLIYGIVSFVLIFVLVGLVLLPIVGVVWLVFTIIGAVRAAKGEEYHYPLTIRMVS